MKILKVILRISLLSLIVLLGFTAIMPNWFRDRDVIYEQLANRFSSTEELILREHAKRKGIPYKQYKQQLEADRARNELLALQNAKLNVQLDAALASHDLEAVSTAANNLSIGEIGSERLLLAIKSENATIFKALYRNSLLCNLPQHWPVSILPFKKDVYNAVIRAQNVEIFHAWYEMGCHIGRYENRKALRQSMAIDLIKLNKTRNIFVLAEFDEYLDLVSEIIWQNLKRKQDANAQAIFEQAFSTLDKKNPEVTFLNRKEYSKDYYIYGKPNFKSSDDLFIYALEQRYLLFAKSVLEHDPNYITRNGLQYHARDKVCYTNFPEAHVVKDFDENTHTLFSDHPPLCVRELGGFRRITK